MFPLSGGEGLGVGRRRGTGDCNSWSPATTAERRQVSWAVTSSSGGTELRGVRILLTSCMPSGQLPGIGTRKPEDERDQFLAPPRLRAQGP